MFHACVSIDRVFDRHGRTHGAAVGAGVGGAVGGIAGAVIGHGTGAVVAGALIGALVGGVVGHFAYDQHKTREETASTYKYNESKGTVLSIEKAFASPPTVHPGDVVDLKVTYALITPSPGTRPRSRKSGKSLTKVRWWVDPKYALSTATGPIPPRCHSDCLRVRQKEPIG